MPLHVNDSHINTEPESQVTQRTSKLHVLLIRLCEVLQNLISYQLPSPGVAEEAPHEDTVCEKEELKSCSADSHRWRSKQLMPEAGLGIQQQKPNGESLGPPTAVIPWIPWSQLHDPAHQVQVERTRHHAKDTPSAKHFQARHNSAKYPRQPVSSTRHIMRRRRNHSNGAIHKNICDVFQSHALHNHGMPCLTTHICTKDTLCLNLTA
mmetsp:Transcript_32504/g.72291  ORF Transcript_32504/g.72291 Transcript_32504/m.72291 type:complete len:208 (-) Transcript_32504:8-631(-)